MAYATVAELAALLQVNPVTRQAQLERVLETAATEIDSELSLLIPYNPGEAPDLVVEVNIERAVEHWKQMESPFGLIGLGNDSEPGYTGRDTWERHAHKLSPLKEAWGIA